MTIRFNNSGGFICRINRIVYRTFKRSRRKMTGSFRLARCFGSTLVTMTVTMIDFKLLLFDVKREESIFNNNNIVYTAF